MAALLVVICEAMRRESFCAFPKIKRRRDMCSQGTSRPPNVARAVCKQAPRTAPASLECSAISAAIWSAIPVVGVGARRARRRASARDRPFTVTRGHGDDQRVGEGELSTGCKRTWIESTRPSTDA